MNIALIIAGGTGHRMKQEIPKQFLNVRDKPVILYTLEAFQNHPDVGEIGDLFRGPMIPKLAKKIDHLWGNRQGIIDARLIGLASRDSILHPTNWGDIGNDTEVFQYLKQLWHTVGYFG